MTRTGSPFTRAALATSFLALALGACGDDGGSSTTDTATPNDTAVADTAVADTAVADTAVADTAVADTATVAQDTATPQDTTPADTTVTDPAAGLCPKMIDCAQACLALPSDQLSGCLADCRAGAKDGAEQAAYDGLMGCIASHSCPPTDSSKTALRASYECQRQCLGELATCRAGSFGAGNCVNVATCINNDCFEGDVVCERACMSGSTADAVKYYLDYEYCALAQCYDPEDVIGQETCVLQASGEPTCNPSYQQCYGNVGGSAGAGAGGGE